MICYPLLNVTSSARADADLALLEAQPAPETTSPVPQNTQSCLAEALVPTGVEEHRLTSVYWFPTGFHLAVKMAINKCKAATISRGWRG